MTKTEMTPKFEAWMKYAPDVERRYGPQSPQTLELLADAFSEAWDEATRRARPVTRKAKVD